MEICAVKKEKVEGIFLLRVKNARRKKNLLSFLAFPLLNLRFSATNLIQLRFTHTHSFIVSHLFVWSISLMCRRMEIKFNSAIFVGLKVNMKSVFFIAKIYFVNEKFQPIIKFHCIHINVSLMMVKGKQ